MCTVRHKEEGFWFIFLSTHGLTASLCVGGYDVKPGPWLTVPPWLGDMPWALPVPLTALGWGWGAQNLPTDPGHQELPGLQGLV